MRKLLFQSDDFGITEAVTLGIVKAMQEGLVRNTGLFTNTSASSFAASFINKFPQCNFGVDINLVGGKPLSNPKDIPSLVDDKGNFISSIEHYKKSAIKDTNSTTINFKEDPFDYKEVYIEAENQVQKYIELAGRKPDYLHPHSLMTPTINRVIHDLSKKYDIVYSKDFYKEKGCKRFETEWNIKPVFKVQDQLVTNVEQNVFDRLEKIEDNQITVLICHCGYIDAPLLEISSYSLIRARDLEMATSKRIIHELEKMNVQLVTYSDLKEEV